MAPSAVDPVALASEADAVVTRFRAVHGTSPRGIFGAPGRVNLIGEHTDSTMALSCG